MDNISKKKIIKHLSFEDNAELMHAAAKTTKKYCGDKVFIRGIIEFSNYCVRNCKYCGLRASNKRLKRYRMNLQEIIKTAEKIKRNKIKTIVLQSGDDFYYTREMIASLIKKIKKIAKDTAITLSIGERPLADYKAFRDAGADRFLLKHETINEKLYNYLHPGQSLKKRIRILNYLKKINFQIGIGAILGLPNQSICHMADDIIFFRDFKPDMIGIGPFIAHSQTPLSEKASPDINLVLRFLALARIVTRNAHIPMSTATATLSEKKDRIASLLAGCNVIMVNFTSDRLVKKYSIYDGKIKMTLGKAQDIIQDAGRKLSLKRGDSYKKYDSSN